LIEFDTDGVSYEKVFVIAPNLVPDAILGINFLKENNVVINLTGGCFKTRRGGFDCEHKFFYDSLPKNKVGVGLISNPKFQLNFSELRRQSDGKDNTGLFVSPSGISELDCATTKTDTAERSMSIGRQSLQVFYVLGALAYFQVPPLGGSREEKWRSQ